MALRLQPSDYRFLCTLVENRCGIRLDERREPEMSRALDEIVVSERMSGVHSLLLSLSQQPVDARIWQALLRTAAIGETYFYRNIDQIKAVSAHVLPEIIERRRASGYRQLRLWSAGCATGEEPYTLAMLLRDLLPDYQDWYITLLATDINSESLEYARQGIYRDRSFRSETPESMRERWFKRTPAGYQLDPSIVRMVTFAHLNLLSDTYPMFENNTTNFDLIMCRNVTIYFDAATTRGIVDRFHQALVPDGWLVVGHAEPLASIYQHFSPHNFENTVLYRRRPAPVEAWPGLQPVEPPAPPPVRPVPPAPVVVKSAWELAKQAADCGNWEGAADLLERAEDEDRFVPQVHYLRALLHLHYGAQESAFQALRRAIYCDPTFALAYYTLGEIHEMRGEYREAARNWQLTCALLSQQQGDAFLPFTDELTVDMLNGLLQHRLSALPG